MPRGPGSPRPPYSIGPQSIGPRSESSVNRVAPVSSVANTPFTWMSDKGPEIARKLRRIEDAWEAASFPEGEEFDRLVDEALR